MTANERRANERAADRLLTAAVKRARTLIADADRETVRDHSGRVVYHLRSYDAGHVRAMLTAATTAADLLLEAAS